MNAIEELKIEKIDVLFFGAHPDDVELCCAGTIIKLKKLTDKIKIGIIDLSGGELGSMDTLEQRLSVANFVAKIMQVDIRKTLFLPDGAIEDTRSNRLLVAELIRQLKPTIVVLPLLKDGHPDHIIATSLIKHGCFYAKLKKIIIKEYPPYVPQLILYYLGYPLLYKSIKPTFIVDITDVFNEKIEVIKKYTFLSGEFLSNIELMAKYYGFQVGAEYGEGYFVEKPIKIYDMRDLLCQKEKI